MKKILVFLLFCFALYAEENATLEQNVSQNLQNSELIKEISNLDNSLKNNIWITRYANYNTYQKLLDELEQNENELKKLDKGSKRGGDLIKRSQTLKEQINLLKEYEKTPFSNMLAAPEMETPPRINSPVALVSGFSYIKKIRSDKIEYQRHIKELDTLLEKLEAKENLLNRLNLIDDSEQNRASLNLAKQEIGDFKAAKQIADTTYSVYEKRADEAVNMTTSDIKAQFLSMGYTAIVILLTIGLTFIAKFIVKRTITDNERFYTVNKFLNVLNITVIIIILLFSYIENVTYLVTVLGFASAGIAIAMKDMFMSMLGWMVIM
ncbi:MAG: mechanosensitive ion channel, partial [Campylobacter concisus]|nr:mechanosensitive ion channel [Campylobacter concisus]